MVTVRESGGDYSSLSAAIVANETTITIDQAWTNDDNFTGQLTIDSGNPTTITVSDGALHSGVPANLASETSGPHRLRKTDTGFGFEIKDNITMTGVDFQHAGADGSSDIMFTSLSVGGSAWTFDRCLLGFLELKTNSRVIHCGIGSTAETILFEQSVCYNARLQVVRLVAGDATTVDLNSCHWFNYGQPGQNGSGVGVMSSYGGPTFTCNVFNSLVHTSPSAVTAFFMNARSAIVVDLNIDRSISNGSDWHVDGSLVDLVETSSTLNATWTESLTPGSGDFVIVNDLTTAPYDLLLQDDTDNDAQDNHADSSGVGLTVPSTDIVGTSRPQTANFDVGPFEIVVLTGGVFDPSMLRTKQKRVLQEGEESVRRLPVLFPPIISPPTTYEQLHYLFREDDGTEVTATSIQGEDVAITREKFKNTRLRILTDSAGIDPVTATATLQYRRVGQTGGSTLGINLAQMRYFTSELLFIDAVKSMGAGNGPNNRGWLSQVTPSGNWDNTDPVTGQLDLRSDGWPATLDPGIAAGALMLRDFGAHYPGGSYVCLYDGVGTLEWFFAGGAVTEQTAGREVVEVTPQGAGVLMKIVATTPGNPIRNIRFFPLALEATEQTEPYRPEFLSRWSTYSCFRFMVLQNTNSSAEFDWANRSLTTDHRQANTSGVAIEHLIDLCNRSNTDPWFCIPHLANDDYVTQFASLVLANLNTDRTVYVEFSNEHWNTIFTQEQYFRQEGVALNLHPNEFTARNKFYGQRAAEVHAIWVSVFGGTSRIIRVVGTQSVNSNVSAEVLNHEVGGVPIRDNVDALAVAPYLGGSLGHPNNVANTKTLSVDQIIAVLSAEIPDAITADMNSQKAIIGASNIDLIAYEAGQHLAGIFGAEGDQVLTDLFHAVNRDAGMEALYIEYLDAWRDVGGGLMAMFASQVVDGKFGNWGLLEYFDDSETSPGKYTATIEWIKDNAPGGDWRDVPL